MSAIIVGDLRDIQRFHFLVARRSHLERRREIGPQLKSMHAPSLVAFRHLLVDDAAACRHPLHVAGCDGAAVSHAVTVFHRSRQNVRDGLDAAVRMPRKARQIILRNIIAEVIQQEERVEFLGVSEAECAA